MVEIDEYHNNIENRGLVVVTGHKNPFNIPKQL